MNILIVEDNATIAYCLIVSLEANGHKIIKNITNGSEVFDFVKANQPEFIISDINLDDNVTGIDAAIDIRTVSTVPIIFISSEIEKHIDEINQIENCYTQDKPIDFEQLVGIINQLDK